MKDWFYQLVKCAPPAPRRDKFIARLLGIFNEDIVKCWCSAARAPYRDLGRPRVQGPDSPKPCTLDFTLESKKDGRRFVTEMKCWVEYQGYRHLTLEHPEQLEEMDSPAFRAFLQSAKQPSLCSVTVNGTPQNVDGAILIWGNVSATGRTAVMRATGLHTVLSLRDIVDDLVAWKDPRYYSFLDERLEWCEQLFAGLRRHQTPIGVRRRDA